MVGNNKIVLNKATVMAAVQEYFDARTKQRLFTVSSVEFDENRAEATVTVAQAQDSEINPLESIVR